MKKLTDKQAEILETIAMNGGNKSAAARQLGIDDTTVRDHLRLILRKQKRGKNGQVTSEEYGPAVGPVVELRDNEIVRKRTIQVNGDGQIERQWLKPETGVEDMRKALKETFDEYKGKSYDLPGAPAVSHEDLLQVYPLADQHVGLLAWGKETGEDYDLQIGRERLRTVSEELIISAPAARRALILGLGDFFHVDDEGKATPSNKNRLDGDGRHYKILKTGLQMQQDLISLALQRHEIVEVVNLPGNHDPHAKMVLDIGLSSFYANNPRVVVHENASRWFFKSFGNNLIGSTHGDEAKPEAMVLRLAEHPDWSSCPHRVFYYGHFHRDGGKTVGSCRTLCVPTITSHDAWGAGKGFVAKKALIGITFHKTEGEKSSQRVNV